MERRLVFGPALRALVISLCVMPFIAFAERELLSQKGAQVAGSSFVTLLLSNAFLVVLTSGIFSLVIARHALAYRDAMRKVASGDLKPGAPEITKSVGRDLLGVRETFDAMRSDLDRALDRLAHADAQRRRLFADLAHELATPASALLALNDTLGQAELSLDDEARKHLWQSLEGETLRVARLVEDIRDLAELDDPDVSFVRERAEVSAVVVDATSRFKSTAGAAIIVEKEEAFAAIDAMRFDQVLTNLLRNARRHTPADRAIRVDVRARESSVVVVVEDSGPGVPPEFLDRLGERLFRVDAGRDRRSGGHGLGLSIVRAIVARHDGAVKFDAGDSGGLRVTLTLPRVD